MATEVLLAVLFAAVMHACYHAIIKLGDDKIAALGLIAAFETVVGAGLFIFLRERNLAQKESFSEPPP